MRHELNLDPFLSDTLFCRWSKNETRLLGAMLKRIKMPAVSNNIPDRRKPFSRTAAPVPRSGRSLLCVLLCIAGLVAGCASRPPDRREPPPACDPSADAAVERGELEKALVGHDRLLAREPANCLAMYHIGYIWGEMGDRRREIHYYEAAIQCGRTADDRLYFNLGMAYADSDDMDRAVQAFERAVAISPKADNYFGLGMVHQASGRPKQAEAALLRAVSADPAHREAHIALVRIYLDQDRWQDAESHLDSVGRIDPANEEAQELRQLLRSRRAMQYER